MAESLERQRTLAATGDHVAFSAEDADFHGVVVRYGANPLLSAFYAGLRDRQRRMTATSVERDPAQLERILTDHTALLALVEQGRANEFDQLLGVHMREVHHLAGG